MLYKETTAAESFFNASESDSKERGMWAAAKHGSLANSEELSSRETQLGGRERSPAVAFSNCCPLGYLVMATASTKGRLVEAMCHPRV